MPVGPIPRAPGSLPLLGHALPLLRSPFDFLTALPAHGDVVEIRVGPFKALLVCDPELTWEVLVNDRTFDKGGPVYTRGREIGGNGIITCGHADHRRQRRLVQPSFHHTRLPGYARTMAGQIDEVTGSWRDGQTIDAYHEVSMITGRSLTLTMFGEDLPSAVLHRAVQDIMTVFSGIYVRILTPPPLDRIPTPGRRRYEQALARLHADVRGVLARHRARPDADPHTLLAVLLSTRDEDGQGLSDTELRDQAMTFFAAGVETTANLLAWALHLLTTSPDVARRLRQETDRVLRGRPAAWEDLPQLELTGRVLTETLRLYAPLWMFTRVTTGSHRLGGYVVPAGTSVVVSPYLLHHQADLFPDPERFDPDRWDRTRAPQPPLHAAIPFGGGARKCVGDVFGMTEAALALATIVSRWDLEPADPRPVRPATSVLLRPRRLRLRVTARTGRNS